MRIVISVLILVAFCVHAQARDIPPPDPDVQSLAEALAPLIKQNPTLETKQQTPESPSSSAEKSKDKNTDESVDVVVKDAPTPIEESFSKRAGQELQLFGYNQIGKHLNADPATGAVQDDMVLGAGDTLVITFRGQRDDSKTYTVTPQGQLIVDGIAPMDVAGLTIAGLKQQLEQATEKNLLNSTVYISIKHLRQINISIMGEVNNPGIYTLSPFQTVLDALAMAKGVTRNGSLRHIRLIRSDKSFDLDFYQLLMSGDLGAPIQLRDGDKIMVPMLGQTIAVAGDVKRPGIYERPPGKEDFTLEQALDLSGNVVRPGGNRFVVYSLTPWGEEKLRDVFPTDKIALQDGDLLVVTGGEPLRTNGVQVIGHVRQPGVRALNKAPDLKTLLNSSGILREGIYPLIGVVDRFDKRVLAEKLIAFSPGRVLAGKDNLPLQSQDKVILFGDEDIQQAFAEKPEMPQANDGNAPPPPLDGDLKTNAAVPDDQLKLQEQKQIDKVKTDKEIMALNPLLTPDIVKLLHDHAASIRGAVLKEGLYPVAGKTTLDDVLEVAGGLRPEAETSHVEILLANPKRDGERYVVDLKKDRPEAIYIDGKDRLIVAEKYTPAEEHGVMIAGEILRPGRYDLRKGDTLSDLIERAGGITETAYPEGTVFMRESERKKEEEQYRRVARELDLAIAGYYMKKDSPEKHADQIRVAENIADQLRMSKGVGRITVEADPLKLQQHPETAILLIDGDKIYIPRRPSTVSVSGEVLAPTALQYKPHLSGSDYIRMAGGTTHYADDGRSFVVFPDGSASPLGSSKSWNGREDVPAGSTIIVPRDPDPLDFLAITTSVGNILAQLAIGSVAIAELHHDAN